MAAERAAGRDLLDQASWEFAATRPGAADDPDELNDLVLDWKPAQVPGTVASSLARIAKEAGVTPGSHGGFDLDDADWWYRVRLPVHRLDEEVDERCVLELGGLATFADVWIDGRHALHSENMFMSRRVFLEGLEARRDADSGPELVIRFAAMAPLLAVRRPRPRWKSYLVKHQNLRWVRTSLMGRLPGWAEVPPPVGPWRPVSLRPASKPVVLERNLVTRCKGVGGEVRVRVRLHDPTGFARTARLRVGDDVADTRVGVQNGEIVIEGSVELDTVDQWWPHTHGPQPLYRVALLLQGTDPLQGTEVDLGNVGFRSVEVDRGDDDFALRVNGETIFCRGAVWMPTDPVSLVESFDEMKHMLELARDAGMNMIRIPGTTVYQDERFWDLCDELGILVWHDMMFAFTDPPRDPEFEAAVESELDEVLGRLSGRPSLAVVCGGQEIESQPAMLGLPRDTWECPLQTKVIPAAVERILPHTPYVTSNPSGRPLPFQMDTGVSHYFGVGGYLQALDNVRKSRVRFATECLAFACAPPRRTVEEIWGGATPAGHDPEWKRAVHHDAGRSWDLEDMQGHYLGLIFGVDPFEIRYRDEERAMDLGRATVLTVMERVLTEMRAGNFCHGALVLAMRDLRLGAGWGLVDALGRPKAPWYAMRRVCAPLGLLAVDEGLNGLRAHVLNDLASEFRGTLEVRAFARGEMLLEEGATQLSVAPRGHNVVEVSSLFEGFRDVTSSYGFGPSAFDVIALTLRSSEGDELCETFHLPLGPNRPVEPDVGLFALASRDADGWCVEVSTHRFAQWVQIDVPGFLPGDSWFHLRPDTTRKVRLKDLLEQASDTGPRKPTGTVRAFNSYATGRVKVESQ